MKTLLLVAGSRAGADFFQSLLDGHSQILQLPGYLRVDRLHLVFKETNPIEIAKKFIILNPEFFDSRYEKFERWNRLGKKKNKFFIVSEKKFIKYFFKISKKSNLGKEKIIRNLHLAYHYAKGDRLEGKKILLVHTHLISWTKLFIQQTKLKNFEILHTIRYPISSVNSPLKTWLSFEDGKHFFPKDLFFQLNLVFNAIKILKKIGKINVIKLEDLHLRNDFTMRGFCRKFKLNYEKCLNKSTKNGLLWWGDIASKKWLNGINKKFKTRIDNEFFFKRDLIFFQNLSEKIMKRYNYKFNYPRKNLIFNILPMKCELLVWKNTLKHFIKSFRWKHFLSIPYFYVIRIILLNKILSDKI